MAWKPNSHVYFATIAMQDALDGKVRIYRTDYATGRVLQSFGDFEVNPDILAALQSKPQQYLAGVVGPDAYPDLLTGQQIIHTSGSHSLPADPSRLEPSSARGSDAWLTYLWRKAYRPLTPTEQRIQDALGNMPGGMGFRRDSAAVRAFVAGYLTHAAGDMFMHTFVNHYAGGDFSFAPDPRNAAKHVVLEGYVGQKTNRTVSRTSIEGVEDFIYHEMIKASPGSVLEGRLLKGATQTSLPYIFSKLRNGLQQDVDRYDRERMERRGPARLAYSTANGPVAEYKRAWVADIDRGLRALPGVSHEISNAIIYNPSGHADMAKADEVAMRYVVDHVLSMAGAPDAVVATGKFIVNTLGAILPDIPLPFIDQIKEALLDYMFKQATGMGVEELKGYLTDPATHFDRVMNAPGGGPNAALITREAFDRDVLKLDGRSHFDSDRFPPAFNTIQMTKLLFLSEKGMRDLLAVMRTQGIDAPDLPAGVPYENVMLGFLTSLDGGNGWHGSTNSSFLARGDGQAWRNLFLHQIGDNTVLASPDQAPLTPPDDTGFELIDKNWAARVDEVKYDKAAGRQVAVTMTFRNDSGAATPFINATGEFAHKGLRTPFRALLDVDRAGRVSPLSMQAVHTAQTAPDWHYPAAVPIPHKGRVTVRLTFDVGDPVRQRLVQSITIIEHSRSPNDPAVLIDGQQKQFKLDRLNLDGTVGPAPVAPVPDVVNDLDQLRRFEGRYQTNRGTILTLQVEGDELIGTGGSQQLQNREHMRLKLFADGSLRGPLRDLGGGRTTWFNLNVRFNEDASRFEGPAAWANLADEPPQTYIGERVKGAASGAGTAAKGTPEGFIEGGFLALRPDMTRVSRDGWDRPRVEVGLTARNLQAERRGIQYMDNTFFLIDEAGVEYRTDGSFYSDSADDRMIATVWLHKDEESRMTLVFPNVPATVKPVRVIVRDSNRSAEIARIELAGLGSERSAAKAGEDEDLITDGPIKLQQFEVTLEKVERGADGNLESVMSLKNIASSRVRVLINELSAVVYGADGQARHADGNFYMPDAPRRTTMADAGFLAPGESLRVRRVHAQSAGVRAVRFRAQEGSQGGVVAVPQ
ncbi:MAG: hypothetical protein EON91_11625 [Brevundimonas sp.]|uniref:hypothetical protein n=1 Tax=Brevundimonas sp. TaxID=1871086 RepID=UPI0012143D51|nr:hypothetical protein [Brevundimonas sp.]RZJ16838.1 MAG: hypothetical protein EON91_11625 [Brevundimonas sp.]